MRPSGVMAQSRLCSHDACLLTSTIIISVCEGPLYNDAIQIFPPEFAVLPCWLCPALL